MDLARYVVEAVELVGRSYREVARAHGVSKSWVAKVLSRYRQGGYETLGPHSRAAQANSCANSPSIPPRTTKQQADHPAHPKDANSDPEKRRRLRFSRHRCPRCPDTLSTMPW
jgi:transposase-like protein